MNCSICNAVIPDGATTCPICGTPVQQTTAPASSGFRLAPTPVPTADATAQPQQTGYEPNVPYNTYGAAGNGVYHGYNTNLPIDRKNNFPSYEMEAGQPMDQKQFFKQRCPFEVQRQIKSAYWICYILGAVFLVLAFVCISNPSAFMWRSGDTAYYLDENKILVYGVLAIACGIGIHLLLSRVASLALLAISAIMALMGIVNGGGIGWMGYMMIAAGIYATIGTFNFQKQYAEYQMRR